MKQTYPLADVADRTGVSPDEIARWEQLGLLHREPTGDLDADAIERVRLLRFLRDRGIQAETVAEASGEDDFLGRYDDALGESRGLGCSIQEAAERVGVDAALIDRFRAAAGFSDREVFDEDLTMLQTFKVALDAGLPEVALVQLTRVLADSLGRVGEAESLLFHFYVHDRMRQEGVSGPELVEAVQAARDPLLPMAEPAIQYFHRRGLDRAMRENMVLHLTEDIEAAGTPMGQMQVTILFVDLASFTPLTEAMGDTVAAEIVDRFSDLARDAATQAEGRVLKQIGDEFMIAFPSARAAVTCGLRILEGAAAETNFPALRLGAHAGTALYREGDFLGSNVNIAARVASEAQRGQFLVTEPVHDEARDLPVEWVPRGARQLKGIAAPTPVYEVRRQGDTAPRVVDPVCQVEMDPESAEWSTRWHERDIYFCSERCRDQFAADPERYVGV